MTECQMPLNVTGVFMSEILILEKVKVRTDDIWCVPGAFTSYLTWFSPQTQEIYYYPNVGDEETDVQRTLSDFPKATH